MFYLLVFNNKEKINNKKYLDLFFNLPPTQKDKFYGHGYSIKKDNKLITEKSLDSYRCISDDTSFCNGIFHIREADFGNVCLKNNHPFIREINDIKYIFAHNGNLKTINDINIKFEFFKPKGTTDSEMSFCAFLENLTYSDNSMEIFEQLYKHCNCFSNIGNYNILFNYKNYSFGYCTTNLHYLENKEGFVISTKPLNEEKRIKIDKHQAILIKNGILIKKFSC
jgi:predicted glutamine amidotransferase